MKPYEPIMFEARQQTKDGRIFPVEVRLSMIRMQGRKLVLGLCRDITERKMAEEKAFENERMLRFAIDQLPVPVIIASAPDIEITHYNRAVVDLLARPIPTVEDIPLEDHREFWPTFYPDGTPYDIEDLPLTRAIHRGEVSHNVEIIVRHDNGDRWISANAAPLLDDRGRIVAGIVVFPDITDLKRAQNELEKHRGHLEEQVAQRTAELRKAVDLMAGREIRMAELKQTIAALRDRLKQAGITPENGKR
jgi:PAS domain-containing protein